MKAHHKSRLHPLWKALAQLRQAARVHVRRALNQVGISPPPSSLMLELFRPHMDRTPEAWRRYMQPLVALGATAILVTLGTVGVFSLAVFLLAIALMYAVLNQVFGIELGVNMPQTNV
jgi:hypothetical protein